MLNLHPMYTMDKVRKIYFSFFNRCFSTKTVSKFSKSLDITSNNVFLWKKLFKNKSDGLPYTKNIITKCKSRAKFDFFFFLYIFRKKRGIFGVHALNFFYFNFKNKFSNITHKFNWGIEKVPQQGRGI